MAFTFYRIYLLIGFYDLVLVIISDFSYSSRVTD